MAKYSNTKAKINEKIATNGRQAVTGAILNDVLQTMVDSLGADYQFGGLVQPGSSFTAGEQPVVFLATTPGTYTNFGGLVVADGEVALLVWSGTAWSKQTPDIATRTEVSQLGQDITRNDISSIGDKIEIIGNSGTKVTEINVEKTVPISKDKIEICDDDGDVYSAVKLRTYKNKISGIDINDDAGESIFAISDNYSPKPKFEIHKNYYVAKDGSAQYSSLSRAIMDAVQKMDSVVYVASGEYNLITEFQEIFGNDFFDNFQDIEYPPFDYHHGLFLMNRIKVVFATGAKVTFPYEGTNAGVNKQFSPFNAGRYGFTIINANVECKNCRYVIHDEMGPNPEPYRNIYEHCVLSGDNTDNQHWGGPGMWCIGGGLGRSGDVMFNDCIFKNADRVGTVMSLVSYHNAQNENDAQSKVVMTGCYFMNGGTFRIAALGNSQKITTALLSNNKFGREPLCVREVPESTTPFNVEIIKWNNIEQ